jgi:hypothetical protein
MIVAEDFAELPGPIHQDPYTGEFGDIGPYIFLAFFSQIKKMNAVLDRTIKCAVVVKRI